VKSARIIGVGLMLAGLACNPEHSLSEVLKNKSCSDAKPQCVPPYVCDEQNKCVMPGELPDAGGSSANAIDDLSSAGSGGAPQQVSANLDPLVGGQGGAAGSESAAAGAGGMIVTAPALSDVDAGCATQVELFRDLDGDGYGSAASGHRELGCPEDGWVERGDDCLDAELTPENQANKVHPGQTQFFDVGYPVSGGQPGEVSFDYDCSSREEPDPGNVALSAAKDCTATASNACSSATGYVPTDRSGSGVNNLCGSSTAQPCMKLSEECVPGIAGTVRAFQCH
jgi:hypothetical protein